MTATDEREVSTFALDVYWAGGRPRDAALEAHLAGCARCRAYLANLDALEAAGPSFPVPTTRSAPRPPPWIRAVAPKGAGRWAWPAVGAVALAAGVALFVSGRQETTGYVGLKGTPAVQVLVHRGADTRIWDGRSPVRPGDALALLVACEGLGHVAVAAPGPTEWARLSNAACPGPGTPLPFTLRVDRQAGDERLAVVLSSGEMDDRALRKAIAENRRTRDVWVVTLVFPKEIAQ